MLAIIIITKREYVSILAQAILTQGVKAWKLVVEPYFFQSQGLDACFGKLPFFKSHAACLPSRIECWFAPALVSPWREVAAGLVG